MAVEVALAMLQRDGRWLMQLRDEIPEQSHVFLAELSVPLEQLQLLEGQDTPHPPVQRLDRRAAPPSGLGT